MTHSFRLACSAEFLPLGTEVDDTSAMHDSDDDVCGYGTDASWDYTHDCAPWQCPLRVEDRIPSWVLHACAVSVVGHRVRVTGVGSDLLIEVHLPHQMCWVNAQGASHGAYGSAVREACNFYPHSRHGLDLSTTFVGSQPVHRDVATMFFEEKTSPNGQLHRLLHVRETITLLTELHDL